MTMRAKYLEGSGPMRVLHSDLLAVLARHVLAVGLGELFAVRSEGLPVTDKSLVAHSFAHLNKTTSFRRFRKTVSVENCNFFSFFKITGSPHP